MDIKLKNLGTIKVMVRKNRELYEYSIKGIKIGVYSPKSMEENILMLENTLDNELSNLIKDEINDLEKSQIQTEAKENEIIEDYAKQIGVKEVKDSYSIEILRDEKDNKSKKDEIAKKEELQKTKITDVNVKQSIELSERANDLQNFRKWLGGKIPPEFTKLVVIDSDDMSQMKDEKGEAYQRNATRYDLALVDKENHVVPLRKYIPELEQRTASGSNPMEQKYQINKEGEVEKDAILSEYEIAGKIIQIDNKEMGRVEVNIGKEEHTGNQTLGMQLRDSNSIYATRTEVREVMGEYERNGVGNVDENLREIEEHENSTPKCEKKHTYEDINGEPDTSHGYLTEEYIVDEEGQKITYEELATRWGKYENGKPDVQGTKEWLVKQTEENPEMEVDQLLEKGDEEHEDPRAPERRR